MQNCHNDLLIISYLDYPYYAGLSTRISGLAKVLAMGGVHVKILAPIARGDVTVKNKIYFDTAIYRVDLKKFRSRNPEKFASKSLLWLLFSLSASFEVMRNFIQNRCLIQYQSIYSALPALLAKILLRAQVIGDDIVLVNSLIDVFALKLTDIVVTPSPRTCSFAKRLGRYTLYLPNGVEMLSEKSSSDSKSRILFVGSLSFDQNLKAVENIIRIALNLDKKGRTFEVLIIGGPLSYVEYLMNHPIVKKGKVKFLGRVSDDRLMELYSSSFIGLLPFFQDTPLQGGQRTKALEFFANHLLIISGPEGVKGINGLRSGEHYLLAKSLNEMGMIIDRCLLKPEKYQNIASAGANNILEKYSWETLTKDYIHIIKSLMLVKTCSGPNK